MIWGLHVATIKGYWRDQWLLSIKCIFLSPRNNFSWMELTFQLSLTLVGCPPLLSTLTQNETRVAGSRSCQSSTIIQGPSDKFARPTFAKPFNQPMNQPMISQPAVINQLTRPTNPGSLGCWATLLRLLMPGHMSPAWKKRSHELFSWSHARCAQLEVGE